MPQSNDPSLGNSHTGAPDADLIARIATRHPDTMAELYRRHGSTMFGLALRIARERGLAEDAVQDAFVQVWRTAHTYDGSRGTVLAWLLTMTRSRTLDRLRNMRTRHAATTVGSDPDRSASHEPSAEESTVRREQVGRIDAFLTVLPPADREVVELAYYEGLTHTEIAANLRVPLGTAKTRLRRAMHMIRSAMRDGVGRPFDWHPARPAASASQGLLRDINVLVVDDEEQTLELMTLVLRRAGAIVLNASSTAQALARVESVWPDVVVADLAMPDRDGCSMMRQLRRLPSRAVRRLPAIAFTAYADDHHRLLARQAGFDLHLAKPIRPSVFIRTVAGLLAAPDHPMPA